MLLVFFEILFRTLRLSLGQTVVGALPDGVQAAKVVHCLTAICESFLRKWMLFFYILKLVAFSARRQT